MQIHTNILNLPSFRKAVITIGTFDGVHTGHRQILDQLKEEARRIEGETVIISFYPHPRKIVGKGENIQLLNTQEEKTELLSQCGIDHLIVVPFTREFAEQPAEAYITDFLVDKIQPHTIIIGYDHRFGKNREGDYRMLEKFAVACGYRVKEISEKLLHEIAVSSTRIRKALLNGEVAIANELLGYSYFFEGTVVHGNKLGRTLGYPTANIEPGNPEKLIPGNGIYAVETVIKGTRFKGMMSIGIRPTIGASPRVIEVNIFNFEQDIYGASIRVYVKYFLRPEEKYNSLEELKDQLAKDKEESLKRL
ncbi:MAG: bifunctional riboflavin kinase/FAD synthetase [Chitinophagaceae bacterium]|nr:bifunctional riboflavin kinase/FAD synthetase [Chitinophagaceae bacterium]